MNSGHPHKLDGVTVSAPNKNMDDHDASTRTDKDKDTSLTLLEIYSDKTHPNSTIAGQELSEPLRILTITSMFFDRALMSPE